MERYLKFGIIEIGGSRMIKKSLIAETKPVANEKNIVCWKDYRVTVLQDRLFRLEKGKTFRDSATRPGGTLLWDGKKIALKANEKQTIIFA